MRRFRGIPQAGGHVGATLDGYLSLPLGARRPGRRPRNGFEPKRSIPPFGWRPSLTRPPSRPRGRGGSQLRTGTKLREVFPPAWAWGFRMRSGTVTSVTVPARVGVGVPLRVYGGPAGKFPPSRHPLPLVSRRPRPRLEAKRGPALGGIFRSLPPERKKPWRGGVGGRPPLSFSPTPRGFRGPVLAGGCRKAGIHKTPQTRARGKCGKHGSG